MVYITFTYFIIYYGYFKINSSMGSFVTRSSGPITLLYNLHKSVNMLILNKIYQKHLQPLVLY